MSNHITFKYYEINKTPRSRDLRIKDIDTYNKAIELEKLGCYFEVELLSTGLYHADVQKNGKQISLSVFKAGDSDKGFTEIFDNAYKRLISNKEVKEKEEMVINKDLNEMTYPQIKEYVEKLELDFGMRLEESKKPKKYEFESQRATLTDFFDDIADVVYDSDHFQKLENPSIKMFLAGGAILSAFMKTEINDMGLYFYTEEDFINFKKSIKGKASLISETDRSVTYCRNSEVFQLCKLFGTPEDIFKCYDYSVCMVAMPVEIGYNDDKEETIFNIGDFIFGETFISDLMSKSLVFNTKTLYPLNSFIRLKKYLGKGFEINTANMMKLALAVNVLELKTVEDIKRQIIGISETVSEELHKYVDKYPPTKEIDNPLEFFLNAIGEVE